MPQEIERKFLIKADTWKSLAEGTYYRQGYIDTDDDTAVILGPQSIVIRHLDLEMAFDIPVADVAAIQQQFQPDAQGCLSAPDVCTVRLRIAGEQGFLTLKSKSVGIARSEYEYEIPKNHALALLDLVCDRPQIEKYRYKIPYAGLVWEVDEFFGGNAGLVVAEVELKMVDQTIELPDWVGEEVSGDVRYFNAYLAKHPFTTW
jgi:CYTH domain-containing protein